MMPHGLILISHVPVLQVSLCTKEFCYYLKGVMNCQVPKYVICIKGDKDFRCIVFNASLLILQVIGHSMWFSPQSKIKVQVSLHTEVFYNVMCVLVVLSCQVYMDCGNTKDIVDLQVSLCAKEFCITSQGCHEFPGPKCVICVQNDIYFRCCQK